MDIDESEIISNIKEKIIKQEKFSDNELIELSLTPIMVQGRENIIRQFKQTSTLMAVLDFPNIEIKESVYGISLMLANMYFEKDDPMRKKIESDFMMKVDCVQEAIEESKNIGIKQGREEGRELGIEEGQILLITELLKNNEITTENAVSRLLSANCKIEKISEITGLSISKIKTTKNKK